MEKIKINPVGLFTKPLNSKKGDVPTPQTNPFGVSFKGIVQADTFEKKAVPSFKGSDKMKMVGSAVVSAFGSLSERFKTEFRTVIAFANKVKEGFAEARTRLVELYKSADKMELSGETLRVAYDKIVAGGKRIAAGVTELTPKKRERPTVEALEMQLSKEISELAGLA